MSRSLTLRLQHLLYCRPRDELLIPLIALRVRLLPVEAFFAHQEADHRVPGYEHEIGVADFVAYEIFIPSLLQMLIYDAKYTFDLVAIALFGGLDIRVGVELICVKLVVGSTG